MKIAERFQPIASEQFFESVTCAVTKERNARDLRSESARGFGYEHHVGFPVTIVVESTLGGNSLHSRADCAGLCISDQLVLRRE